MVSVKNRKNFIWIALLSVIIMVVGCVNLDKLYGPIVVPDEIGYWATGYFFNGNNWNGIMGTSSYYGWGYGAVLGVLCFLIKTPVTLFRCAIVLNNILLVCCFVLTIKICETIFPKLNKLVVVFMSFAVTVYSGYIYYSQTTYCEVLLMFIFLCTLYFMAKAFVTGKNKFFLLTGLGLSFLLAIHLRTFVVTCAAVAVMVIFCLIKKISLKQLLIFMVVLVIVSGMVIGVKEFLTRTLYANSLLMDVNTVSGQVDKLSILFSFNGIMQFFGNFIGKIMYLGTSTFLFFYVSIYTGIKKIVRSILKKEQDMPIQELMFLLFVGISIVGEIALASYSFLSYGRLDHIFYGRYTEFLCGVIVLYGLTQLYQSKEKWACILSVFAHIAITAFSYRFVLNKVLGNASAYAIPGLWGLIGSESTDKKLSLTIYAGAIALCVFVVIVLLFLLKKRIVTMTIISVLWILIGLNASEASTYAEQSAYQKLYSTFGQDVEAVATEDVYYIINDTEYVSWLKFKLKFFMPNVNLIAIESAEFDLVPTGSYMITYNLGEYYDYISDSVGEKIVESYYFTLSRKQ